MDVAGRRPEQTSRCRPTTTLYNTRVSARRTNERPVVLTTISARVSVSPCRPNNGRTRSERFFEIVIVVPLPPPYTHTNLKTVINIEPSEIQLLVLLLLLFFFLQNHSCARRKHRKRIRFCFFFARYTIHS